MIALSNLHNIPLSMAVFLADDNYDGNSDDPFTISVTSLLRSTRQAILYKRLPDNLVTDISDKVSSRLGQAYHKAVEDAWLNKPKEVMEKLGYPRRVRNRLVVNPTAEYMKENPDSLPVYLEQRNSRKVGRWTITGQFDLVVLGTLEDIKSTSVYTYMNQTNTDKYIAQGSMYRWINPDIITEDQMNINYIFTDWVAARARTTQGYPPLKLWSQPFKLDSVHDTDKKVRIKLKEIDRYLDADESKLPLCSDKDLWRKPPVWKYYSKPSSTSSRKNFDNLYEAQTYLLDKPLGRIEKVEGQVTACKYCAAFSICSQKDRYLESGELKL
jgi:hypothetical protein